jgi:hypothetical protein
VHRHLGVNKICVRDTHDPLGAMGGAVGVIELELLECDDPSTTTGKLGGCREPGSSAPDDYDISGVVTTFQAHDATVGQRHSPALRSG